MSDSEHKRIKFLENTRGKPAALAFAKQTYKVYRASLKTPYGKSYRRSLIESLLYLRKYIRE